MNHRLSTILRGYVDGSDRGVDARLFRALSSVVSVPYSVVVRIRNLLYDLGIFPQVRVDCATVVVGNLTMGGVGKTPFVGWLTRRCLELGRTPGLISRGYQANRQKELYADSELSSLSNVSQGALNDEAIEQAIRFPNTPHFLGSKRVEVARALLAAQPTVDVILLDDAFQHRQIARDLNILLLDALNPFGGKRVAPSGFLREPLGGMKRADVVVLNRADMITPAERLEIQKLVAQTAPKAAWAEIAQRPTDVYQYVQSRQTSSSASKGPGLTRTDFSQWRDSVASKRFVAFCGLGAPSGFQKTLAQTKLDVASFIEFPDHCIYGDADFQRLRQVAAQSNADAFITTMKDFVKLKRFSETVDLPVYALGIGIEFMSGQAEFERLLTQKLQDKSILQDR